MAAIVEIHWTAGNLDEVRKVSRYLVQERYVACAQIIPWIESVFMWDNKLDNVQESKVIFKTLPELYDEVQDIIRKNCSYEVPEITLIEVKHCNDAYLQWVIESVSPRLVKTTT